MKTTTENEPVTDVEARTPSGAESLDDLAREADLLDTAPEATAQAGAVAQAEQLQSSTADELRGVLEMVRAMVFPILGAAIDARRMEALGKVWNDGVLHASADAGARIMNLHGWTMGGAFDRYGPYVMLAVALGPPVIQTRQIMAPDPVPKNVAPGGEVTPAGQGAAGG